MIRLPRVGSLKDPLGSRIASFGSKRELVVRRIGDFNAGLSSQILQRWNVQDVGAGGMQKSETVLKSQTLDARLSTRIRPM